METPEELAVIVQRAKAKGLKVYVWKDTIKSEILDTYLECEVGCSIGPADDELLKQVTGQLSLF